MYLLVLCYYIVQPKNMLIKGNYAATLLFYWISLKGAQLLEKKKDLRWGRYTGKVQNSCFLFLQMLPFQRAGDSEEKSYLESYL